MKEVESRSKWIGAILDCQKCNRSFKVEAGDEIKHGFTRHSSKQHVHYPKRFELPCGHIFPIK